MKNIAFKAILTKKLKKLKNSSSIIDDINSKQMFTLF